MKKLFTLVLVAFIGLMSCSDDDTAPMAEVKVNNVVFDNGDDFFGDVDGDFIGDGGTVVRMFNWESDKATAEYNADITATAEGTFQIVVKDADGSIVLDRMLDGAVEPDSFSGVTSAGTPGVWTVTITLTDFKGDGSFSLSEGN